MDRLGRLIVSLLLLLLPALASAQDVDSMVACKEEGDEWLCAAYKNGTFQIFHSDRFIAKVEFTGEFSPARAAYSLLPNGEQVAPTTLINDQLPSSTYTIQLMACDSHECRQKMNVLKAIPNNKTVYINNEGKLWQVLTVGGFSSKEDASLMADQLSEDYGLTTKPWVRTTESIQSRIVEL